MAKKRIKRSTNTPSKRRQQRLFSQRPGANGPLYRVTASDVTDKEIKWMASTINRRLRALEKAGLTEYSNEYEIIKKYATGEPNKKGKIYNVNYKTGDIRITSSTRGMTGEERAYLVTVMRNIMKAKTSTVRGTQKARVKGWQTFIKKNKIAAENLPFDKYNEMWKLFRLNVDPDRKDRLASQAVVTILRDKNFYDLDLDDMERSFQYLATTPSTSEWVDAPFRDPDSGVEKIPVEYIK